MLTPLAMLIGRPLLILMVGLLWGLAALALRRSRLALLVNSVTWLLFAGWEGLILVRTPEANIRADLLLIVPLLIGLGLWGLVSTLMCLKR